jgi:hypothetical protein
LRVRVDGWVCFKRVPSEYYAIVKAHA